MKKVWAVTAALYSALREALKNKLNIHASSCTYYFLVSLVPILILTGWGVLNAARRPEVNELLNTITLYTEIMRFVSEMGISIPKASFSFSLAGILSIGYALWSASALMRGIGLAFRTIFASESRRKNLSITLAAYFFIPLFLIASIMFVSLSKIISHGAQWLLADILHIVDFTTIGTVLTQLATYMFIWMAALLAFTLLTPRKPSKKAAMIGSLFFCIYFVALQNIVMTMTSNLISRYAVYGALSTLLVILLWAYFVFFGLFVIAQFTAILDNIDLHCRRNYYYAALSTRPGIISRLLMLRPPFASALYHRHVAKDEEIPNTVSFIKIINGTVRIGDTSLYPGQCKMLSADERAIATQSSELIILEEDDLNELIKYYPEIWQEIGYSISQAS